MGKTRLSGLETTLPRSARWADGQEEVPGPEVPEKPIRRRYPAQYKARILAEADACTEPGPKAKPSNPLAAENERLRRENQRLTEKLRQAEAIIDVQKKYPRSWGSP